MPLSWCDRNGRRGGLKAAYDATHCRFHSSVLRTQIDAGRGAFESAQLEYGRNMTDYGIASADAFFLVVE